MRIKLFAFLFVLFLSNFLFADISEYRENFLGAPLSSRPHTWWHWMNGNVTKEGITADLEAMADVGIGGAQIFNVGDRSSVNIPVGPADYMSDQWLDLVRHAVKEANRLGIEICMHNCAGWSSSGGPWITPEYAMKKVTYSDLELTGPGLKTVQMPEPGKVKGYYKPICVLAFPTPDDNEYRIPDISVKAVFQTRYGIDLEKEPAPQKAIIQSDSVIDITGKMNSNGLLKWDCPPGKWTVLRIGYTITGKDNHPAPDSGLGLECDKLSRAAMDVHWKYGIKPILDKLGDLAGPTMNNLLIDSYEVGLNNWTAGFEKEFEKRRGYSLKKYLPALTGRVIDDLGISERFLWDFRRTTSDMFTENYFNYFAEKCHKAGLLCSTEPYDGPFECMSIASKADILMGEFWVGGGINHSVRIASSVAHVYGRKIVGAESFTSGPDQGRWQNHPRSMKTLGDSIWCNGINRYIFHRYAHQPWLDKWPGMTMGQWGTHFERTNTWWDDGREWMHYIARSQYLLQAGKFHADILFFGGEYVPNGAVYRPDVKQMGYDYDAIGTDLIEALSVVDGRLVLPSGMSYSILVMPDTKTMSLPVAKKIKQLLSDGATILANCPQNTNSLTDFPESQNQLKTIAKSLWPTGQAGTMESRFGSGRLLSGYSLQQALDHVGIKPDFEVLDSGLNMNFIHRVIDGVDVYFVSNQQDASITAACVFNVTGKKPEFWDSQRAVISPASMWQQRDGRTQVTLNLEPAESVFVVFNDPAPAGQSNYISVKRDGGTPAGLSADKPIKLEIVKAEYGVFDLAHSKMVDVTKELEALVANGRLSTLVSNQLAGDPADGVVKKLLVEYEYDGKKYSKRIDESQRLYLPDKDLPAGKTLVVNRAVYGDLPDVLVKIPELKTVDVTEKLAAQVSQDVLSVRITNSLAGGDPVVNVPKHIRVLYKLDGVEKVTFADENQMLNIPFDLWVPSVWPAELCQVQGSAKLKVWDEGTYRLKKTEGGESVVNVDSVPKPVKINGPWAVSFESKLSVPNAALFKKLISLSDSPDPEINGFSGTATYSTSFEISKDLLASDKQVTLDLGRVEVMAHVFVNGKDLGILWKNPYRLDISKAVRAGRNKLEVRVTNLWVNRIIADEAYPEDCQWQGKSLAKWPDWFVNNEPRPTQRQTFFTWKHWKKGDPLLPSGLIGPVYIRAAELLPLKD